MASRRTDAREPLCNPPTVRTSPSWWSAAVRPGWRRVGTWPRRAGSPGTGGGSGRQRMAQPAVGLVLPGHAELAVPPAGFPYDGPDPDGFMVRDEIVGYLEAYAAFVRRAAGRRSPGDCGSTTGSGSPPTAGDDDRRPGRGRDRSVPAAADSPARRAARRDAAAFVAVPGILRSCRAGEVVVVGTGQSGCQIAEDLHLAGRRVHLVTGQRAAGRAVLPRTRCGRLAGRDGLLPQGNRRVRRRRRGPLPGEPLRHRPGRRPRHRPAEVRHWRGCGCTAG